MRHDAGTCDALGAAGTRRGSRARTWQFYITPYLWLTGLSGTASAANPNVPSQNVEADFGDILSHLDAIPVMGAAEVRYGRFGLSLDFMRVAVQTDFSTPNVLFGGGSARLTQFFASLLGLIGWFRAATNRSI